MKSRWIGLVVFLSFTAIIFSLAPKFFPRFRRFSAWGDDDDKLPFPKNATVTTLITTPRRIEGLTGDNHSNLYTDGAGTTPCPVWQINLHKPSLIPVGFVVPAAGSCDSHGIASNKIGDLFVVDGAPTPATFTHLTQASRIRPSPPFSPPGSREPTASPSIRRETSGLVTE